MGFLCNLANVLIKEIDDVMNLKMISYAWCR